MIQGGECECRRGNFSVCQRTNRKRELGDVKVPDGIEDEKLLFLASDLNDFRELDSVIAALGLHCRWMLAMSVVRRAGSGPSAFHWDLVASALHALADLIENCAVDRQLFEFDPNELREHASKLEEIDPSSGGILEAPDTEKIAATSAIAAPEPRSRLESTLASTVQRVGPHSTAVD